MIKEEKRKELESEIRVQVIHLFVLTTDHCTVVMMHFYNFLLITCPEFKLCLNVTKKAQGMQSHFKKVRLVFT